MKATVLRGFGVFMFIASCQRPSLEQLLSHDAGLGAGAMGQLYECEADTVEVGCPCFSGLGWCKRTGTYIHSAEGLVCDADVPDGGRELCDTELDEDCDGLIDEAPDDGCCSDADCEGGLCEITVLPGKDAGGALELRAQGGVCAGTSKMD